MLLWILTLIMISGSIPFLKIKKLGPSNLSFTILYRKVVRLDIRCACHVGNSMFQRRVSALQVIHAGWRLIVNNFDGRWTHIGKLCWIIELCKMKPAVIGNICSRCRMHRNKCGKKISRGSTKISTNFSGWHDVNPFWILACSELFDADDGWILWRWHLFQKISHCLVSLSIPIFRALFIAFWISQANMQHH